MVKSFFFAFESSLFFVEFEMICTFMVMGMLYFSVQGRPVQNPPFPFVHASITSSPLLNCLKIGVKTAGRHAEGPGASDPRPVARAATGGRRPDGAPSGGGFLHPCVYPTPAFDIYAPIQSADTNTENFF